MTRRRISLPCSVVLVMAAGRAVADPSSPGPVPTPAPASPAAGDPAAAAITGRVVDGETGEGLAVATIVVRDDQGAEQTLFTELDGSYTFALAPGRYTLAISAPDYLEQRRTITATAGAPIALDIVVPPAPRTSKSETIEIYSTIDTRRDSAVLAERRLAATVTDAVSAQQIARSPDSSAADAAKRMVAATIQDNRYLVVRGLGGRYSTTLLNGVPLPSPDPDVPAAPLDLFPAALITNLTVHKTFSPELPGNFAGGALAIETRSYPTSFLFKARVGIAGNTRSAFRTINGQDGGRLDLLGFDDGHRALPGAIPGDRMAGDPRLPAAQRTAQIAGFKNNWSIERATASPNLGVGVTLGDTLRPSGQRLGYFASASFGHSTTRRRVHIARVGDRDGEGGRSPSVLQLDDDQGIEQANLGALAGLGWTPAFGHKIDLFTLYSHSADITSSAITGVDNSTSIIDRTRLQFLQRALMFSQLVGDDRLSDRVSLGWQAHAARVAQHEPDTRDLLRTRGSDSALAISTSPGSSERLFGELGDTALGGAATVRVTFDAVKLAAGGSIQRSTRDYQARRFHFGLTPDAVLLAPDQAFAPERAGAQMSMDEVTLPSDGYTATRTIAGGFAMVDIAPTARLRLIGGARFEQASLDLGLDSTLDPATRAMPHTERDDRDLLPSLHAVYAFTPATHLRAAYATTVARPNFRELAPAIFYDHVRRRVLGGNPGLRETTIHNGDLRLESFLGDSEVLAASVFAKHFAQPIERTVETAGDGDNISFANARSANSYGVELEARLSLGRLAPALSALSVAGNLSLIGSSVALAGGAHRALQGQSPYVANLALGYEHGSGARVDLAYNAFGRRIEEVGTGGAGDIYEQPFHRLDLTVSQPLPRNLRLKLAASNLLDQRVTRTQDGVEIFAYDVGVTVLGSVEYSLDRAR